MRYFLLAGEASGDLHGSGLVRALRETDGQAEIQCWGGDRMEDAGAVVLKHYKELAFMGFVEVLLNLGTIMANFRRAKKSILEFRPDALILIDYPGFNLRMAKWAHKQGIPVHYYISPQLWAWKEGRIETVRNYVDRMYVILPFEKQWYEQRGVDVEYVGHPLLEAISAYRRTHGASPVRKELVGLLPGSRQQEIKKMLPVMLEAAKMRSDLPFVIARAPHIPDTLYDQLIRKANATNVTLSTTSSYDVLSSSSAALTTSGTATLETALFGVPQVVCYKGSQLSFEIAKRLIKVPFISLVNLIAGKPVVEELIQENVNPDRLRIALDNILDKETRSFIMEAYNEIESKLNEGGASQLVAEKIVERLTAN